MYKSNTRKGSSSATTLKQVRDAKKRLNDAVSFYKGEEYSAILAKEASKAYAEMVAIVPYTATYEGANVKGVAGEAGGSSKLGSYRGSTGKLMRSVYCRPSKSKAKFGIVAGASAWDSYRQFNYAGVQHENTSFYHDYPRQAHYISEPLTKYAAIIIKQMREAFMAKLKGGK